MYEDKIRALQEKRRKIRTRALEIIEKAESRATVNGTEVATLSAEEESNYDSAMADVQELTKQIERYRGLADIGQPDMADQPDFERVIADPDHNAIEPVRNIDASNIQAMEAQGAERLSGLFPDGMMKIEAPEEPGADLSVIRDGWAQVEKIRASTPYRNAVWKYVLGNKGQYCTGPELRLLNGVSNAYERGAAVLSESDVDGGYLTVSMQFAAGLQRALQAERLIRRFARTISVRTADSLGIRKRTQRASTAKWSSETATPNPDESLKFGLRVMTPHFWDAEGIISRDAIRRTVEPIEQLVIREILDDVADLHENSFITGTSAQQPLGFMVASIHGVPTTRDVPVGTAGGDPGEKILFDGMKDAKYQQYRYWNQSIWLLSLAAVKEADKVKHDTTDSNRYLWEDSVKEDSPDRMLGRPAYLHEFFSNSLAENAYVGVLVDFSRGFLIADALDVEIQRLVEVYARTNQIGLVFRGKMDAMPILEEAWARLKMAA